MTYLPSLIKKIDDFYSLTESLTRLKRITAQDWSKGYVSPDDGEEPEEDEGGEIARGPGLYQDIMAAAGQVGDDTIASELMRIAELYKRAIEINGGFKYVANNINEAFGNIFEQIDSEGLDEDIKDIAENILEEAASDLRKRSKTSIGQQMDEPSADKNLRELNQVFLTREARGEMEGQKSVFEKGKPNSLAEVGHGIAARKPLETPQKYAKEIERLEDSLINDPTLRDSVSKQYVEQLVDVLKGLLAQIPITLAAKDKLKVTPEDLETQNEFKQAEARLTELRNSRNALTRRLNTFLRNKEIHAFLARMNRPGATPQEKSWWTAKMKLEELRKSQDLKKAKQIKLLNDLIHSTGRLDKDQDYQSLNLPDEMKKKLIEGIEREESYGGDRQSKKGHDRGITEERAKNEGREAPAERAPQRGGWGVEEHQQRDFSKTTLPGFVSRLQTSINTAVDSARRYIASVKEGGVPELKQSVDKVSAAIREGNDQAKYKAISDLKNDIAKYVAEARLKNEVIIGYEITIRLLPFFRKVGDDLKHITTLQRGDGTWSLTPEDDQLVTNVITYMTRFSDAYNKQYKFRKPRYDALVNGAKGVPGVFPLIIKYLKDEVLRSSDDAIAEAAGYFDLFSFAQTKEEKTIYDRQITQQTGREQGKSNVPAKEKERGGWSPGQKKNDYDVSVFNFAGLVKLLEEKINSGIGTAKEKLTRPRFGGNPELKTYVDAVTTAIRKGDTQAKYQAIKALKMQIAESIRNKPASVLEKAVRLLPHFRSLKDDLRTISKWQSPDKTWSLDDAQKNHVTGLIDRIRKLQGIYEKYYGALGQLDLYYAQAVEMFGPIIEALELALI